MLHKVNPNSLFPGDPDKLLAEYATLMPRADR